MSLESIAEQIDPDKIDEEIGMKHREAKIKYKLGDLKIKSYQEFKKTIIGYVKHHQKEMYHSDMPDEMAFTKAMQFLEKRYEREGGFIHAFKQASSGKMDEVIEALARHMEGEHKSAYVNNVMSQIDPLDFDQHVEFVKEYTDKYGSLLPEDMKKKSPEQLANQYQSLISHHTEIVQSVKGTLKKYEPGHEELDKAA